MRIRRPYLAIYAALILAGANFSTALDAPRLGGRVGNAYAHLPLTFEENRGQFGSATHFAARTNNVSLLLNRNEILVVSSHPDRVPYSKGAETVPAVHMQFVGANPAAEVSGIDRLEGKANYFIGKDPAKWITNVPTYGKVKYTAVYPGVDLLFYSNPHQLEYDFTLRPGADPATIVMRIIGANSVGLHGGNLAVQTSAGTILLRQPQIYQTSGKQSHRPVEGSYSLRRQGPRTWLVSFQLAAYDHRRPLTIDPVLDYSSYLGGTGNDYGASVAVDSSGNAYVVGQTASLNFPTTSGSVQPTHAPCTLSGYCEDAFVTKINPSGTSIVYSTFLGGSSDEFGVAIAVDGSGNAYVAGNTTSPDFPTTTGAFQRTCGGTCFYNDGFVAELNSTGSGLLFSTYLGGSDDEFITGIASYQGRAIVSGYSDSPDFPVTAGAFQTQMQGQGSSFVAEFNSSGTALAYSTFLGEVDLFGAGPSLAVDGSGNAYLAGVTYAPNFPVTSGAFHTPFLSNGDTYISKLNSTGSALIYSALIGGAILPNLTLDPAGNVYVAATAGTFYPLTPGALNESCNDQLQGTETGILVAKLNASGSNLAYASHLCPDRSWANQPAVDAAGNLFLTGYTDSRFLPTTVGALQTSIGNACCFTDAFLTKMNSTGSARAYSTYFGGNSSDNGFGLVADAGGNVYLSGATNSTNLRTRYPFQAANGGQSDAFIAKFSLPPTRVSIFPASVSFGKQGVGVAGPRATVTFANLGTTALGLTKISATGDFTLAGDCGTQLAAGTRCTIGVVFRPSTTGLRSGTLTFADSTGSQSVALRGTGVNGALVELSVPGPAYAPNGQTGAPVKVTVTNVGNADLNITSFSLTNGPVFNFGNNNCFTPIAPLSSCFVQVTYSAVFGSPQNWATLSFNDNAAGSPQGIIISGITLPPGVQFSTSGLRFDEQPLGTSSTSQQVAIMNGTPNPISISSIGTTGDFKKTQTCGSTLAAGALCYVNVSFRPIAVGIRQGSVVVNDSATGSPQILPLLATGDAAPAVTLQPTSLSFPAQAVGSASAAKNILLTNSGGSDLKITGISVGGTAPSDFTATNNCGTLVAAGASCTIAVTFKPVAVGTRTAVISITDNAKGSPQKVSVSGTGS